jgi:hypothetical protein
MKIERGSGQFHTPFEEMITWDRAMQLTPEEALHGEVTVSLETQRERVKNDFDDVLRSNLPMMLKIIRNLSREDQEMLLSYHMLRKSQAAMARIYPRKTQTIASYQLRRAGLTLGAYLLFGTPITKEAIAPVLVKAGCEENKLERYDRQGTRSIKTSYLIETYAKVRDWQRMAEGLHIFKPEIRRTLSRTSKVLLKWGDDTKALALGAYIFNLIAYTSRTKKSLSKQGHVYMTDPLALGSFVIDVNDPAFEEKFTARAAPRGDVEGNLESLGNPGSGPFESARF